MEVQAFIEHCMQVVGTRASHARSLAHVLLEGDLRGHYSHGLNRMDVYVTEIRAGICARDGEPVVEKESAATALVNGKNLLGPVVGNYCMSLAVKKAQDMGVGWVVAHGSNHFGIAAYYSMQALKENMIGMAYTNTSPLVVPTRAKEGTLGTNPISVAAPAMDGDSFVLDMATSAVALGKVEIHERNGVSIPEGWGCDSGGRVSTEPKAVLSGGGLVPLGGNETTGSHKGYGLSLMVEVFCGMLAGAQYSKHIRTWRVTDRMADLGQCFVAVNPEHFAPGFNDRMSHLLSLHRNLEPVDPGMPVMAAGDPERKHMQTCQELGGIPYYLSVVKHMNEFASTLGVRPLLPTHRHMQ
uniref:Malate dehydrogenase n=2 Tax=Electrophorus electricus TaxID=8005 RepID=A0A4W4DP13_ELEEL